jgi:hypothetical protein
MDDLMAVVLALSRIQGDLRMMQQRPDVSADDVRFDDIVNLATVLQARVQQWRDAPVVHPEDKRRAGDRRQHAERRRCERRQSAEAGPMSVNP